jgi:nitrous oxidase accessory protein NosD
MLLLVALAFPGPATASHVECGDAITQDTTLDGDLACTGDGLTIAAGDVTLELAGHTIQGAGSGVGVSVPWEGADFADVQIRGGTIHGFGTGVRVDEVPDVLVAASVLEGNGTGLNCFMSAGCSIADSVVRDNFGTGVSMSAIDVGTGRPSLVRRNRVHDNEVGLRFSDYRAVVSDNRIEHNRHQGITAGLESLVEILHNRIERNGAQGVLIGADGSTNVTLFANRIERNAADGVFAGDGGDFGDTRVTVRDNRANRNGDDGIDVDTAEFSLVAANRAYFNVDLGLEAGPGTADGGGNRAKHNGNPAQCVGIRCR